MLLNMLINFLGGQAGFFPIYFGRMRSNNAVGKASFGHVGSFAFFFEALK